MNLAPLRTLLLRELSPDELRRGFSAFAADDGAPRAGLPGPEAGFERLVDEALAALDGPLLGRFLVHLATARPELAGDLREVAAQLGVSEAEAFAVASLLSAHRDAAAASKLAELERASTTTAGDRHELNLAVADLHRWQREAGERGEASGDHRAAIARRLTSLAASMSAQASSVSLAVEAAAIHPDALRLREEIEAHVRRADGKRAALRLLDLAERFGDPRVRRRALELSARAGTWRTRHVFKARLEASERREWLALLHAILALTDEIVQTAASGPLDALGEHWLAASLDAAAREALHAGSAPEYGPLVRCDGLSLRYRKGGPPVLKDVSLTVFPRTVVAVVGPNGAGKTTFLRVLAGELRVDDGMISYPQLDPALPRNEDTDWPVVRSRIAHVPQRVPRFRGRLDEYLHVWAGACGLRGGENVDTVDFWLERLGLAHCRSARWRELSRSLQTRVALARALVGRPRLLLVDEPLVALDPRAQQWFLQDLRDIVSSSSLRLAAVVSSQHIPELEAIADDVVGLRDDGGVWFHGGVLDLEQARRGALFEIGGHLEDAARDRLTAEFGPGCLRERESVTLLRVGGQVSRREVLELLCALGEPPVYFRDISGSHMRMFWGDRP
ncbi:ABC-type multidrug transport system, ATPase component [Nannocystis exedens]|uniref:ABC-type multidrug transport system, ATPase component n=1 Tax=Nannocystis exedens TaxID=54 RepID=A0A1I2GN66_9BACT|nr:ABC transporter ATP-binding protein [Nannocystis exedens]PCC73628.1 putative ABC transporter [Nannocystis exedens]SFF18051.1 ABC-type multidrug transport system, ATPase component [Nannocystis exedens]